MGQIQKKLKTVEMVRCEVCNRLHPKDEVEIVVVKIVKGIHCDVNDYFAKTPASIKIAEESKAVATERETAPEGSKKFSRIIPP